jgi:hypothetical protein
MTWGEHPSLKTLPDGSNHLARISDGGGAGEVGHGGLVAAQFPSVGEEVKARRAAIAPQSSRATERLSPAVVPLAFDSL